MNKNITIKENCPSPTRQSFTVTFFGVPIHTTVTSSASAVKNWIYRMWHFHRLRRGRLIVGLGIQWRPSFNKGFLNPAATLQLCIGRNCLIFQLLHKNAIPRALVQFLADPSATFVGIWSRYDSFMLQRDHGLYVRTFDMGLLASERKKSWGLSRASMETLASVILGLDGVKKPRRIGVSEWDARHLSLEQVQYACVDAHVSFRLGKALHAWQC